MIFHISKKKFEKIDKESSAELAKSVLIKIFEYNLVDPYYYTQLYNKFKAINLVYYGDKIENQIIKENVDTNSSLYEGFNADIN